MIRDRIRLLLSDWDGVIGNSLPAFYSLYRDQHPEDVRDIEAFREHIACLDSRGEHILAGSLSSYAESLLACKPFPGMVDALRKARTHNIYVALVTRLPSSLVAALANQYGLEDVFDEIYSSSSPWLKPDPQLLGLVSSRFNVHEAETVFAGDQVSDVLFVKDTRFHKLFSTYGFHTRRTLEAAISLHRVGNAMLVDSCDVMAETISSLGS